MDLDSFITLVITVITRIVYYASDYCHLCAIFVALAIIIIIINVEIEEAAAGGGNTTA